MTTRDRATGAGRIAAVRHTGTIRPRRKLSRLKLLLKNMVEIDSLSAFNVSTLQIYLGFVWLIQA